MTLDDALFVAEVLRTPIGDHQSGESPSVMAHRETVRQEYERLKREHPEWHFRDVSKWARAKWLWQFVNSQYRRDIP